MTQDDHQADGGEAPLAARLEKLEIVAEFQERDMKRLNEVMLDVSARIEALKGELQRASEQEAEPEVGPQNDPPPHY